MFQLCSLIVQEQILVILGPLNSQMKYPKEFYNHLSAKKTPQVTEILIAIQFNALNSWGMIAILTVLSSIHEHWLLFY